MIIEDRVIMADEGKIIRRIADNKLFGWRLHLGYIHVLHNERLDEPIWGLPEHYDEIDYPVTLSREEIDNIAYERAEYNARKELELELLNG